MAKIPEVISARREVIESKLLTSLSEQDKVAVILDEAELTLLIDAMSRLAGVMTTREQHMVSDLRLLRSSAFPEWAHRR